MRQLWAPLFVVITAVSVVAAPKFMSVWKSPDVTRLNFAGKKVAALVITDDQPLQMSGEEALVRELNDRGVSGLATYRIVPREEIKDPERAKGFFARAGVEGVVALRPVSRDRETVYSPVVWVSGYYPSFWGYYGYGWSSAYVRPTGTTVTIVVETLVYNVTTDKLVWAATSETRDPKTLQDFVKDLVKGAVSEMKKMKLVG
jgi:hypothetical protein